MSRSLSVRYCRGRPISHNRGTSGVRDNLAPCCTAGFNNTLTLQDESKWNGIVLGVKMFDDQGKMYPLEKL